MSRASSSGLRSVCSARYPRRDSERPVGLPPLEASSNIVESTATNAVGVAIGTPLRDLAVQLLEVLGWGHLVRLKAIIQVSAPSTD